MTGKRQRRRWLFRVAALLLLGAAINVLVAWACALWSPVRQGAIHAEWMSVSRAPDDAVLEDALPEESVLFRLDRVPRAWREYQGAFGRAPDASIVRYAGVGLVQTDIEITLHDGLRRSSTNRVVVVDAGWPWRCVSAEYVQASPNPSPPRGSPFIAAPMFDQPRRTGWRFALDAPAALGPSPLHWPTGPLGTRTLPFRPLLPGSVAGAGFWASALAAPWLLAQWCVRSIRRRRGLCPACGYDLQSLPTCPECGTASRTADVAPGVSAPESTPH